VTRKKRTLRPWAQAAIPNAVARCDLPGAGRADQQDVLPFIEIIALDQLQQQRLVDARASREVKLVEQLVGWEAGGFEPPFRRLAFPFDQLQRTELEKECQVVGIVGRTALSDLLTFGIHRGELESLQMMLEQHTALGVGLVHGVTSPSLQR
jgi:hypothetical protein